VAGPPPGGGGEHALIDQGGGGEGWSGGAVRVWHLGVGRVKCRGFEGRRGIEGDESSKR